MLSPQAIDQSRVEVSPRLYRGLVDAAWSALAATGHRGDTILIGETAPRGITTGNSPGNFSGMVPLRFIRALYCVDTSFTPLSGTAASERGCPPDGAGSRQLRAEHPGLFQASGFADHPYPQGGHPPNVRTPDEPDYADLASIGNLESTLDRAMAAYGVHTQLPIFSTEFGYQTDPPEKIANTTDPVDRGHISQLVRIPDLAGPTDPLLRPVPAHRSSDGERGGRLRDRARIREWRPEGDLRRVPPPDLPAQPDLHRVSDRGVG